MGMRSVITKIESLNPETYAGFAGELWLDNISGKLHVGSGATPGGNIAVTTDATGNITLPPGGTINYSDGSNALVGGGGGGSSLINGSYSLALESNGNLTLPATGTMTNNGNTWTFGSDGTTTLPNGAKLSNGTSLQFATDNTVVTSLDLRDTTGRGFYTDGSGFVLRSSGDKNWQFGTGGILTLPSNNYLETTDGNLKVGSQGAVTIRSNAATVGSTKSWTFGGDGSLTVPGEINSVAGTGNVVINANDGVLRSWTFGGDGALAFPDSTTQTTAYKRTTGSWTVATGSSSYSFTVPNNGTYVMWVRGNIANGIIVWNATATVTNNNVPVIGQQYAWNYTGGGTPIELTAIPGQFIGTSNTIVSSTPSVGTTSNVFDFTINNTSGSAQTIYWGYVTQ